MFINKQVWARFRILFIVSFITLQSAFVQLLFDHELLSTAVIFIVYFVFINRPFRCDNIYIIIQRIDRYGGSRGDCIWFNVACPLTAMLLRSLLLSPILNPVKNYIHISHQSHLISPVIYYYYDPNRFI